MGNLALGVLELSAVRELANIGVGHATTALAELLQRPLNMSVPDAEAVSFEEIPTLLGSGEDLAVGIYMPVDGEIGGHMAFFLPWPGACELWTRLLGTAPKSADEVTELEGSVMVEVGNIMISSFLNAIADMTDVKLHATPPLVSVEMSNAILGAIVTEACAFDQVALALRTSIQDEEGDMDGFFVYLPTLDGLRLLFSKLGIPEAA